MTPLSPAGSRIDVRTFRRSVDEMLDAHVMGPRVRAALGLPAGPCHVLDAKYEPGRRCTVLYRAGDQLVRGDLLGDGPDAPDPPRPVVPPGVRLHRFPDDPGLPGLPGAVDPASLAVALADVAPGGTGLLRCRVQLVRYRPGRRATLAVEVRRRGAAGTRGPDRVVVKSYHDDRKAAAVAAEAVLLEATADPAAPLRFAPVVAHVPELSLVVQQRVAGVRLDETIGANSPASAGAVRRAARALAALHGQPVVSGRARAVDAELTRFLARGQRIEEVDPGNGSALVDLAGRLAATARQMPAGAEGLVHGDCKPSQFLLRNEDVVLLDLDSCGRADPAGDVGTFLATLRQQAARRALSRRGAAAPPADRSVLTDAFLEEYTRAVGGASDGDLRARITWYEAVALERKALRCFARAPRSPLTRVLVDLGHARLDRLEGIR